MCDIWPHVAVFFKNAEHNYVSISIKDALHHLKALWFILTSMKLTTIQAELCEIADLLL